MLTWLMVRGGVCLMAAWRLSLPVGSGGRLLGVASAVSAALWAAHHFQAHATSPTDYPNGQVTLAHQDGTAGIVVESCGVHPVVPYLYICPVLW